MPNDAIFYVLSTGCQWQALPKDLPPKSTAHSYFMLWDWDGTLERVHHARYVATREREGREASPTAAIIDSQSASAAIARVDASGGVHLLRGALAWVLGRPTRKYLRMNLPSRPWSGAPHRRHTIWRSGGGSPSARTSLYSARQFGQSKREGSGISRL
jgi:transposase